MHRSNDQSGPELTEVRKMDIVEILMVINKIQYTQDRILKHHENFAHQFETQAEQLKEFQTLIKNETITRIKELNKIEKELLHKISTRDRTFVGAMVTFLLGILSWLIQKG